MVNVLCGVLATAAIVVVIGFTIAFAVGLVKGIKNVLSK